MNKILVLLLACALLASGCTLSAPGNLPAATEISPTGQGDATQPIDDRPGQNPDPSSHTPGSPTEEPLETLGPDCYGEDTHPIGQSIADLYPDQTNYEAVMVWFCNGFEFEDILSALQTSEESDIPAAELLARFEHGQTWEDIWISLGLVEP